MRGALAAVLLVCAGSAAAEPGHRSDSSVDAENFERYVDGSIARPALKEPAAVSAAAQASRAPERLAPARPSPRITPDGAVVPDWSPASPAPPPAGKRAPYGSAALGLCFLGLAAVSLRSFGRAVSESSDPLPASPPRFVPTPKTSAPSAPPPIPIDLEPLPPSDRDA